MRYTELIEHIGDMQDLSQKSMWQKTIAGIKQDCQPWLKQINYDISTFPIYRGLGTVEKPVLKKKVRLLKRRPTDTSEGAHELLNKSFTTLFGEPFRNAMFASGDFTVTNDYGNLYMVFPIGEFTFIWSSDVKDIFSEHENQLDRIAAGYDPEDGTMPIDDIEGTMLEYVNNLGYHTTDLKNAIASGSEIMIRCESYYALQISLWQDERNWMIKSINRDLNA